MLKTHDRCGACLGALFIVMASFSPGALRRQVSLLETLAAESNCLGKGAEEWLLEEDRRMRDQEAQDSTGDQETPVTYCSWRECWRNHPAHDDDCCFSSKCQIFPPVGCLTIPVCTCGASDTPSSFESSPTVLWQSIDVSVHGNEKTHSPIMQRWLKHTHSEATIGPK